MTLKDFIWSCNTNTVDIFIFDAKDEEVFSGPLHLVTHVNAEDDHYGVECRVPRDRKDEFLNSKINVFELTNQSQIDIYLDDFQL